MARLSDGPAGGRADDAEAHRLNFGDHGAVGFNAADGVGGPGRRVIGTAGGVIAVPV